MASEFEFIEQMRSRTQPHGKTNREIILGIGDDCAAFKSPGKNELLLVSTDLLTEGVHFELSWSTPEELGRKLVAVNLSDIAAMGGQAKFLLWALSLPAAHLKMLEGLAAGVESACRKYGVALIGGDTNGAKSQVTLCATVLGEVSRDELITRAGAKPGDLIFCTGTLGDSFLGLELCRDLQAFHKLSEEEKKFLRNRFLLPEPRLVFGRELAKHRLATAMIDISDGLIQDLGHLLHPGRLNAILDLERIPLSSAFRQSACAMESALTSGEDYELLFTASEKDSAKIQAMAGNGFSATPIGQVQKSTTSKFGEILLPDGSLLKLSKPGFRHF